MGKNADFIALFLDSVKKDYDTGGLRRIVPTLFLLCMATGFFIAFNISDKVAVFPLIAALITAQGIILAMGMQTSGVILNNISQGDFSLFLKRADILSYYSLLVQLIQIINISGLFLLLSAAVVIMMAETFLPIVSQVIFGLALGSFLYTLRWAWGTTTIVKDLIHYRSEFHFSEAIHNGLRDSDKIADRH